MFELNTSVRICLVPKYVLRFYLETTPNVKCLFYLRSLIGYSARWKNCWLMSYLIYDRGDIVVWLFALFWWFRLIYSLFLADYYRFIFLSLKKNVVSVYCKVKDVRIPRFNSLQRPSGRFNLMCLINHGFLNDLSTMGVDKTIRQ